MTTYTVYADPGHAWIKVPLSKLIDMGIVDQITGYSYMTLSHAYLEEDKDMGTFVSALSEKERANLKLKEDHTNKESRIRDYASYDPQMVRKSYDGLSVMLVSGEQAVLSLTGGKSVMLTTAKGVRYKATTANILTYVVSVFAPEPVLI